jgi:hypothetical protein
MRRQDGQIISHQIYIYDYLHQVSYYFKQSERWYQNLF